MTDTDKAPELLPCPFCGGCEDGYRNRNTGKPMIEEIREDSGGGWRVHCYTCSIGTHNGANPTKKDAIAAWNRRADGWRDIATHPRDNKDCLLAIFTDGVLYVADHGGWESGEVREEWDEVEDGLAVKLYEDKGEGNWWSNHGIIDEPTHWQPLPATPQKDEG